MEGTASQVSGRAAIWWDAGATREYRVALAAGVVLSVVFGIVVFLAGPETKYVALFPLTALILFMLTSFEAALAALVIFLFVDFFFLGFSSAVWYSLAFGLAFLVHHGETSPRSSLKPMAVPILVYGVCILPSILNSEVPLLSTIMLFNVVAYVIVVGVISASVGTEERMKKLVGTYIILAVLNGCHIVVQSLAHVRRPFGFAGIMFVDYGALAACLCAVLGLTSREWWRLLFLGLAGFFAFAVSLTRTRNTLLSGLITLVILVLYLLVHPEVVGMPKKRLMKYVIVAGLVIGAGGALAISINPSIGRRALELGTGPDLAIDEEGLVTSSLTSRLFVWSTAYNAFRAQPVVGIGAYAFPFVSEQYSTLPEILYQRYVKGVSPHQTFIAVLTETGIVGAIGFGVFLVALLRLTFGGVRMARDRPAKARGLFVATAVLYCIVSMFFTDAWLWGQGIVLLGIVTGVMLAHRKMNENVPGETAAARRSSSVGSGAA